MLSRPIRYVVERENIRQRARLWWSATLSQYGTVSYTMYLTLTVLDFDGHSSSMNEASAAVRRHCPYTLYTRPGDLAAHRLNFTQVGLRVPRDYNPGLNVWLFAGYRRTSLVWVDMRWSKSFLSQDVKQRLIFGHLIANGGHTIQHIGLPAVIDV